MAVNIAEIGTVYDALETKIVGTLTTEYDAGRLKGKEYAEVITAAISALISSSVTSVLEQPVKEAQVSGMKVKEVIEQADSEKERELKDAQMLDIKVKDFVALAESEKERELKDAQILLAQAQVDTEDGKLTSMVLHDRLDEAEAKINTELKNAQKSLIQAQEVTEDAKATLTDRQTAGYDDQARVKRAEILNNTIGMFGAGGTAIPTEFVTNALAAAVAVSTEPITASTLGGNFVG